MRALAALVVCEFEFESDVGAASESESRRSRGRSGSREESASSRMAVVYEDNSACFAQAAAPRCALWLACGS